MADAREGKVTFRVEGEFIVDLARSLWADELEMVKAVRLLTEGIGEMTEDLAVKILTGGATLKGVNEMDLVPDNAVYSRHGNLLSLESVAARVMKDASVDQFKALANQQIARGQMKFIASPWGGGFIPGCVYMKLKEGEWSFDDVRPWFNKHHEQGHDRVAYGYRDGDDIQDEDIPLASREAAFSEDPEEDALSLCTSTSLLDTYIKQERERKRLRDVPPRPAKGVEAENGWVAPNGSFYTCGIMEHDFLAERMGVSVKDLEKTHVRISVNPMSDWRSPLQFVGRRLTQAQKDVIWDWCQHHKEDVPPWVFGDEGTSFKGKE